MTIFVASLFLPYTVNFDAPGSSSRPLSPELERPQSAVSQTTSLHEAAPVSLFTPSAGITGIPAQTPGPIPPTPGSTTDHERIFRPHIDRKISLRLPNVRPGAGAPIRTISRHDLHSPGWGKTFGWNQPPSRAKSPPPSSILKHAAGGVKELKELKEKAIQIAYNSSNRHHRRQRTRTVSHERRFSNYNYEVERAPLGNGGLYNAIDAAVDAGICDEKTWVGTLGCPVDALDDHMKENIAEKLENDYDCLTVYASDSDLNGHYEHYCKTILWPVVHYQIPDHPKSKAYEDHSWVFYVKVNEAFAERIAKNWKKGDKIWIHDYHLMLLPGLLRQKLPEAEIGFFLHTAFPSSEIFRCLAVRTELLQGMLGANMIGFQNDEYGHHFLQTCSRLLNVEATKHGVILEDGRFVHVDTCPIGIDPKAIDHQRQADEVKEWVQTITEKYRGKRIIVARDKLDTIRGVRQKILSYELFLNKYPEYRDQVVLIQIATSSAEDPELSATVADIVTRVNSTHSTLAHQPLVFLKQDIDFAQYMALLTVAECLMITSLREGMNLTSHEWIVCQDGKLSENKNGPLILSEFTGSATVFGHNAILVNPWHYSKCADAIKHALDMSPEERERRWKAMYDVVIEQNAVRWYEQYLNDLEHAWKEHRVRDSTAVPRLSVSATKSKYQKAKRRLIILDYEGTLASWGSPTDIILTTPKRSIDVLNDLIEDKKNIVYVMSSRMPEEMERLFSQVSGLGLIAENGAFVRDPGTDEWQELVDTAHVEKWKKGVRSILQYYVERVEGSRIEMRHASIIFDYSDAEDTSGAFKQAGECANHINDACRGQNVNAIPVDDGLCISEIDVNKGAAAQLVAENLEKQAQENGVEFPDYLMVIGDSREDEYVFNWAHKLEKAGKIRDVITVTLGARSTEASATLTQGVTGVLSILEKLARGT
ncbi:trehalose-phosphatase [Cladophialophora carrionii CBS 160.54]|uniref:Trehalose-phosphatase n=1 Tax=Cladophialophora carrionii CBS 160.54 TaxID=1279043 RepID=V9DPL6_9EURO|nr:trehalose-phosphatase [Cladophialophora carrionii CBS 160.54]ETI28849.1 trehalose-phosphatase [Cladophialophora carrionii CBS 160.54]